jgi:hypothetical protein
MSVGASSAREVGCGREISTELFGTQNYRFSVAKLFGTGRISLLREPKSLNTATFGT